MVTYVEVTEEVVDDVFHEFASRDFTSGEREMTIPLVVFISRPLEERHSVRPFPSMYAQNKRWLTMMRKMRVSIPTHTRSSAPCTIDATDR